MTRSFRRVFTDEIYMLAINVLESHHEELVIDDIIRADKLRFSGMIQLE